MANISLDEEEIGIANIGDTLTFPNVRSCTAIAVYLKSGQIVGGHYTQTKPDESFSREAFTSNFLYILRRIAQERIRAALFIRPKKKAYNQGLGQSQCVFLISSSWGYDIPTAEANIKMHFQSPTIVRIDVDVPGMDIIFNTSNKQLVINNHDTNGNIKTYQNFLKIPAGLNFV